MIEDSANRSAFARLERARLRRIAARIEPRLRVEIALLVCLTWGFTFWRARIPFHSLALTHGWDAVVLAMAGALALLVLASAVGSAMVHWHQLHSRPDGPEWLALPLPAESVLEHAAWSARLHSAWAAALAPGILGAAVGLAPWWAIAALALVFVAALVASCRIATRLVQGYAIDLAARAYPAPAAPWRLLATVSRLAPVPRLRAPGWRRWPAAVTLAGKDLRLTLRRTPARSRLAPPLILAVISAAAWALSGVSNEVEPALTRFIAFGLALVAAAACAEWLIALAAGDPLPILRSLPLAAGDLWLGRALLLIGFTVLILAGHALAARSLAAAPLQVHLIWLGAAVFAIGLLGIHYGMTLPATAAARILVLTLSIAMAASIMIPLLGWILLLTAVIHSARRVPRWSRLEPWS